MKGHMSFEDGAVILKIQVKILEETDMKNAVKKCLLVFGLTK